MKVLKRNSGYICKLWLRMIGSFATAVTIASVFVTWGDIHVEGLGVKVCCLGSLLLIFLIISILYACKLRNQKVIWQGFSGKIVIRYADLLKEGFDTESKREKLYVIPVNSSFDTVVDTDISLCDRPLISPNTLHGKWIKMMNDNGMDLPYIDNAIDACLKKQKKSPREIMQDKEKGKKEVYDLGTIAMVRGVGMNTFLLLALTDFDENNNAYVSIEKLEKVIKCLIDFYDQHGQGHELVVPLMGTNFARAGLTSEDCLKIIAAKFQLYKNRIRGDVSIVIRKEDRDRVTIDI